MTVVVMTTVVVMVTAVTCRSSGQPATRRLSSQAMDREALNAFLRAIRDDE